MVSVTVSDDSRPRSRALPDPERNGLGNDVPVGYHLVEGYGYPAPERDDLTLRVQGLDDENRRRRSPEKFLSGERCRLRACCPGEKD
jgi:hypothetical protein